jgi:hypothetical protein
MLGGYARNCPFPQHNLLQYNFLKVSAWLSTHAVCETGLNLQSFVYKGIHGAGWAEEEEGILHQPL